MTVEDMINALGKSFRGLWVSHMIQPEQTGLDRGWAVTFVRNNEYCESPYHKTAKGALEYALVYADK